MPSPTAVPFRDPISVVPRPGTPVPTSVPALQGAATSTTQIDGLSEADWVEQRLRAIATLYCVSPVGIDMLLGLDVRQMTGQPGYFGSYGFESWTGIGQASPVPTMHELSHAYWGAFPVTGYPELSWAVEKGAGISTAMTRYHRDVIEFMKQPPGPYEIFRSVLRNIPGLSEDFLDGLFTTSRRTFPTAWAAICTCCRRFCASTGTVSCSRDPGAPGTRPRHGTRGCPRSRGGT